MNKFSDMSTFVAVVESGSFSEAARRLGTAKSIVSQRVQQLEKRLGCTLLNLGPQGKA
nr:LysR family transcriptional regulator [Burkholderia ubonensis]